MASIRKPRKTRTGLRHDVVWTNWGESNQNTRTFHTIDGARTFLREVERAWDERRPYRDPDPDPPRLTLTDLAAVYLRDRKRITKSAESLEQRRLALEMFVTCVQEAVGGTPLPEHLSRTRLSDYHAWLQQPRRVVIENGKRDDSGEWTDRVHVYECNVGTANTRVRYVEAWWRWLHESDDYPDGTIPRPKRIDLAQPPAPPQQSAPTWAEMSAAIDCARPPWARLMTVLYFTGLRGVAQALRLRRTDLDIQACTLTVRPEIGKSKQERAGRAVPVSPLLVDAVQSWPLDPDGWLILWDAASKWGATGKREADPDTARRILKRAGVRPEVYETKKGPDGKRRNAHPLHCFRAGLISGLSQAGVDERVIKKLVGHSGGVTLDRYTEMEMREAVGKIPPLTPRPGGKVLTMGDYSTPRNPNGSRRREP